jgi:hypothetical protein
VRSTLTVERAGPDDITEAGVPGTDPEASDGDPGADTASVESAPDAMSIVKR